MSDHDFSIYSQKKMTWNELSLDHEALLKTLGTKQEEMPEGSNQNQRIFEALAKEHQIDVKQVEIDVKDALESKANEGLSNLQVTPPKSKNPSKKSALQRAEQQSTLPMFGEIFDNIFDNRRRNSELLEKRPLLINIDFVSKNNSIHDYIRISENSGGVLKENASALWVEGDSIDEGLDEQGIGVWGAGLKLALPHLGRWHQIETLSLSQRDQEDGSPIGQIWQAGAKDTAIFDEEHPESNNPRDYWHEKNRWWGEPGSTAAGKSPADEKQQKAVMKKYGQTIITIQRLTDPAQEFLTKEDKLQELIQFIRNVYGKLVSEVDYEVKFKITHPTNMVGLEISNLGNEGAMTFVNMMDESWYCEHLLALNHFMPVKVVNHELDFDDDKKVKVTIVAGILRDSREGPGSTDDPFDFLAHKSDPYRGVYMWGNGRMFTRARRHMLPATTVLHENVKTLTKGPYGDRKIPDLAINWKKSQTSNVVVFISFQEKKKNIPWSGPVKWDWTKTTWNYEKEVMRMVKKLVTPLAIIDNLLYQMGAHSNIRNVISIDTSDVGVNKESGNGESKGSGMTSDDEEAKANETSLSDL